MLLLVETLGHGGLAVDCAGADAGRWDGAGRVRLTLQRDGYTFLRCTSVAGLSVDVVSAAMVALAERIGAASATVAALRALLDALVLGTTLALAFIASASAGRTGTEIVRPALVFAGYAVLTPLRGPLLRLLLRQALRWAPLTGS